MGTRLAWVPLFCLAPSASGQDGAPWGAEFDLRAELDLAWRAVSVDGSRAQFEEAFGLASGPLLRALALDLESTDPAANLRRVGLDLSGWGDTSTRAELQCETRRLNATGTWTRSEFDATGPGDLHALELRRQGATVALEPVSPGQRRLHGRLEFSWSERDALTAYSRSVDFGFVAPVPTARRERELGLRAELGLDAAGWKVDVEGGGRSLSARDRRDFALPSPSAPSVTQTEDFDADLHQRALEGGLRVGRTLGSLDLDAGAHYGDVDGSGDLDVAESGVLFDPLLPFRRNTTGQLTLFGRTLELDLGLRWRVDAETALFLRGTKEEVVTRGRLDRHSVLDEAGSVSSFDFKDVGNLSHAVEMLEAGCERELGSSLSLALTARTGRERDDHLETVEGSPTRDFEGTFDRSGVEGQLEFEPRRDLTLSLEAGTGLEPVHNTFEGTEFEYGEDRASWVALRARWGSPGATQWTANAARRDGSSEAFDSESSSTALALSCSARPSRKWSTSTSVAWRRVELDADTVVLFGLQQFDASVGFESDQWTLAGDLAWLHHPRFQPSLHWASTRASGTTDFSFSSVGLDLPVRIASSLTLGLTVDARWLEAHPQDLLEDYRAWIAMVYCRLSI